MTAEERAHAPAPRWSQPIAIVGMACRVPGALSVGAFWQNLCHGVASIHRFTDGELLAAGVPASTLADPSYVKAAPLLEQFDCFDAALFRYSPREAAWLDPQHRVFLQTAWEALEDAAYDPFRYRGSIGVFAGAGGSVSSYLFAEAARVSEYVGATASVLHLGNDKDFLPTRVSYKLNLRGPAVNVQTACSTSLVAVHLACQALRAGEADMALAGGVSIRVPQRSGYFAREGDVVSPDGVCRPFAAAANGTVFGSGTGVVVLKPFDRALADGDHIYALVRGSATNNDGGDKLSYTATSVAGQEACMRAALAAAGVESTSIGYVEAHGTATYLGDPLEIDALNRAYAGDSREPCGVGSVKGNVGHLEAAAGVLGLIKAALTLHHEQVPASLHCDTPNPRINFAAGPFRVVRELQAWPRGAVVRRAAVNSLGVGGTNAHVVLEEAPALTVGISTASESLLCLSANRPEALVELARRYASFFESNPQTPWLDACFTAAVGRAVLNHRLAIRARNATDAARQLRAWAEQPTSQHLTADGDALARMAAEFVQWGRIESLPTAPDGRPPRRISLPTYPFARDRHWLDEPRRSASPAVANSAGLLGPRRVSAASGETTFETLISPVEFPLLRDHRLYDRVVVPGATYLAMLPTVCEAAAGQARQVAFVRPLALGDDTQSALQLVLQPKQSGEQPFAVYSRSEAETAAWAEHARGVQVAPRAAAGRAAPSAPNDWEAVNPAAMYEGFRTLGLDLGPTFQTVREIQRSEGQLWARICAPQSDSTGLWMHPAALDGCLQLVVGNLASARECLTALFLPMSVERFAWHRRPSPEFTCHVRMRSNADAANSALVADLTLFDEHGSFAELDGMVVKRASREAFSRSADVDSDDWLHAIVWKSVDLPRTTTLAKGPWLIIGEAREAAQALAGELQPQRSCVTACLAEYDRWPQLLSETAQPFEVVAFLVDPAAGATASPVTMQEPLLGGLLTLVQTILHRGEVNVPRLCVVTRGAQEVTPDSLPLAIGTAPLWGFMRALAHEHSEFRGKCIDLDPRGHDEEWKQLAAELTAGDAESQVAFRGSQRYVARLQPLAAVNEPAALDVPEGDFRLSVAERGSLDNLQLEPVVAEPPGPGEVQLAIEAAGLNFRDVLNVLGRYPGDPGALGMECAGVVRAVGSGVEGMCVGDRVVALAQGSLATTVNVAAELVARRPETLSAVEGAAIPVVFATAELALARLAKLRAGQRVLIHAASGGVGWAALQIARRAGAEVFATANRDKWEYLRRQGVTHIYDSRSVQFAEQVRADTGGRGCDVVLNSLAGEFIPASLAVLAPGGQFVELGKQGIWTAEQVAASRPDVAYHVLALDQLMATAPGDAGGVLRELLPAFVADELAPPPVASYPVRNARQAFRRLQQAQHVGKLVVSFAPRPTNKVRPDANYLVIGGLGGLGRTVCSWLADSGARHLTLLSRHELLPEQREFMASLAARGVEARHFAGDVADETTVAHVFAEIAAGEAPLRGVFHLAAVLDDGAVTQQTWPRFEAVLAPKVAGAWNLHRLSRDLPLDWFVLFSSSASWLGAPGQSSYAAANAFLDALAAERVRQGLPAMSIAWGPWDEAGVAARLDAAHRQRLEQRGLRFLAPPRGVELLNRILAEGHPQVGAFDIDWATYRTAAPNDPLPAEMTPRVGVSVPFLSPEATSNGALNGAAHGTHVRDLLTRRIRQVLGWPESRELDSRATLPSLGLDSLMAVELLHQLRTDLRPRLAVPPTLLFDHPTLDALVEFITAADSRPQAAP